MFCRHIVVTRRRGPTSGSYEHAKSSHSNLPERERPTAAELPEAAWTVVGPLVALTPDEREYTDRLQAGEFRPDLLFPDDDELAARVARHPALDWKAENAKRRKGAKG